MSANSADSPSSTDSQSTTSSRIPVDVRRLPWVRSLAADYAYNFPAVAPFFAGDPSAPGAWTSAIARAQTRERDRNAVASLVARQQQHRNAPAAALEAGARLAQPSAVAVVTGQQAGLFGGPLFTLLKAITAIQVARRLHDEHDVPAAAVFWVDGEDHDWDEVRSCTVLDEQLAATTIALPPRTTPAPTRVADVPLDAAVLAALDELESALVATDFRAEVMAALRRAYQPGRGMAEAFARWIEELLGPLGLVVFDSSDPSAKPLAAAVFSRELASPGETSRLAAEAGAGLVARGYHAQVTPQQDSLALFWLDGGRRPIRRVGEELVVGEDRRPAASLVKAAAERPEGFSPNVLLRPIVQDTLFPTVCYVAGPNELAYLGQLRGVYDRFGVPMPLMYPRGTATLLDSAAMRFLGKYDLSIEALQPQDDSALNALLKTQIPPEVEQSFNDAAAAMDGRMAGLASAVAALDPTLEGATRSTLGRMQHDLKNLHAKIIQAAKRRDDTLRRQFTRTRALAFPDGHAQERTVGFAWFLNQYGPTLVDRLQEAIPPTLGRHWVIAI